MSGPETAAGRLPEPEGEGWDEEVRITRRDLHGLLNRHVETMRPAIEAKFRAVLVELSEWNGPNGYWTAKVDTLLDSAPSPVREPAIDAAHLARQRAWSVETFGPGLRTRGVIDHIRKELREIEAEPTSLEWIDVVILALDGAWRAGHEPQAIIDAIVAKQTKNEGRTWPDWRTASEHQAIEHDRSDEPVREPEGLDVARLAEALNATVGAYGWLRSTPGDPAAEWLVNAEHVAAEYARLVPERPADEVAP